MIELLLVLLLNSLYCLGFYLAADYGMILSPLNTLEPKLGKWYKPIAGCITCMASLHSWLYLVEYGFDWMYIPYVFALAGLNTIIYNRYIA